MNERIRQLAVQAHAVDNTLHYYNPEFIEKFAKLIVQECANYIRENYDSWDAEPLAHNMEVDFGLHGDYAE
jgi:chorismate mutase